MKVSDKLYNHTFSAMCEIFTLNMHVIYNIWIAESKIATALEKTHLKTLFHKTSKTPSRINPNAKQHKDAVGKAYS